MQCVASPALHLRDSRNQPRSSRATDAELQPCVAFITQAEPWHVEYRPVHSSLSYPPQETTMTRKPLTPAFALVLLLSCGAAGAVPRTYELEPSHTYPSFEADHMGMSLWRGKFNRTAGSVVLDHEARKGSLEVEIDLDSIDYGQDQLNDWARGKEFFDTAKHPKAIYRGELKGFSDGKPTEVVGSLTLHGVTRPLTLKINSFKCQPHPMYKRDWCGADAIGTFNREEFGLAAGKDYGFDMNVTLRIQAEALLKEEADPAGEKSAEKAGK
jgi:polyisoprenoid-binding protein YceI